MPHRVGAKGDLTTSNAVELVSPSSASATIGIEIRFNPAGWSRQLTLPPEERLPLIVIVDDPHQRALVVEHSHYKWQAIETDDSVELHRDIYLPESWKTSSDLRLQLMQVHLSGVMHLTQSLTLEP